ncbi:MAG: GPR1/FUN34/YaaH family transporter, partial [Candidatus Eremiobacteraeota bacterium]|nr:GPR1/FUN34/YaaH family transporter [Candidatus Eremiobacteraeota bacterium]
MPPEVWTKAGQVPSSAGDGDLRLMQERRMVSVAEPAPFGLFAFAIGTIVVAVVISGFEPLNSMPAAIPMVVFVAGVGQFIAGLYGFARSDTFTATAFCSYGATNVYVGTFYWMVNGGRIFENRPE